MLQEWQKKNRETFKETIKIKKIISRTHITECFSDVVVRNDSKGLLNKLVVS